MPEPEVREIRKEERRALHGTTQAKFCLLRALAPRFRGLSGSSRLCTLVASAHAFSCVTLCFVTGKGRLKVCTDA